MLLTRDDFRNSVFLRDNYRCVVCGASAKDAHHILERRLWDDGGYYLNNGASVCEMCHLKCESTEYSPGYIRQCANIANIILPSHLYEDQEYDKWGNIILPNGQRIKGELFFDESVQKIIQPYLSLFTDKVKYSRTHHLPWSLGVHDDDRVLKNTDHFIGKRVICTEKMDGENTSIYTRYFHARSIDESGYKSYRNWVKNFVSEFQFDIPEGWRICGENLYAQHSIPYDNLESYFYGFSIWNEKNIALSWDETKYWFDLFGITSVPVLYDGIYDEEKIKKLWDKSKWGTMEGYVIRMADEFSYGAFRKSVAKFVRDGHVQTTHHWNKQEIIHNRLK